MPSNMSSSSGSSVPKHSPERSADQSTPPSSQIPTVPGQSRSQGRQHMGSGSWTFRPHSFKNPRVIGNGVEFKVVLRKLPAKCTTWDVYTALKKHGSIERIEIENSQRNEFLSAWVTFSPPPASIAWVHKGTIDLAAARVLDVAQLVRVEVPPVQPAFRHKSPINPRRDFPDKIRLPVRNIQFGVTKNADTMLVHHQIDASPEAPVQIVLDLQRKILDFNFAITTQIPRADGPVLSQRSFKMRLAIAHLHSIVQMISPANGHKAWVLSIPEPPLLYRKAENIRDTHDIALTYWNEFQSWMRQTDIPARAQDVEHGMAQLQTSNSVINVGRWLSYCLVFDGSVADTPGFRELCQALNDHSIPINGGKIINYEYADDGEFWDLLDNPVVASRPTAEYGSGLSGIHQMTRETIRLPFAIRYQLEVCLSHGVLLECNITQEFLTKLATMDETRAMKLLEKAAGEGERFFNPNDIFPRLLPKVSIVQKPIPWYCATIRAATVTPTTIYLMTPIMETSNRVVRKYHQYQDRFLRVKFIDERYKGKVMAFPDATMNEVFTRVKRTMVNGINVAGRHYQFLAFGNSQFRESGAWFFAPTGDLTVQKIREDLGDFDSIKLVAKYCSRIGQCFSTTRVTRWSLTEEKIPDIKRNDFTFTDGVGKISPFLAEMIANELGFPSTKQTCPSAFQFRREGCKGILVVDPNLPKGKSMIQVRPSQEKFPGVQGLGGLEVVRVSQFSTACLNVQLILVLSSLGVEDSIFVNKMRQMVVDLQEAMHDETKARELLCKNVDFNHMTLQLASIISEGFLQSQDPFTVSCLHLWRSWSLKYLKEKAKIFVEEGAFVLGCVDETATLRGHFDHLQGTEADRKNRENLPQIFLQINRSGKGQWTVVTGVCILMRNPSLHPGDIRVVEAVDVPALHHIRDCVVLPQTGDRDLANMCSGGDLDGDDYLVIWDEALIPKEWNHPPMDYTGPEPIRVSEDYQVTADDMSSFFVTHMKYDILAPIAVAHKYWADALPDGIKNDMCLELAQLHSMAVDYAKTGVPAEMPRRLKVQKWPHWSEVKNKAKQRVYHSKKVIGQLYDIVERDAFRPVWTSPFDERILTAYEHEDTMLQAAREAKAEYDADMRRVMAKFGVENEFEAWTTFVLKHSDEIGDYQLGEKIGEAVTALKDAHQKLCYEKAGTSDKEREWEKLAPFVAAMYTVTAQEVAAAVEKGNSKQPVTREKHADRMPLISFPWLFPTELGRIANDKENRRPFEDGSFGPIRVRKPTFKDINAKLLEGFVPREIPEWRSDLAHGGASSSNSDPPAKEVPPSNEQSNSSNTDLLHQVFTSNSVAPSSTPLPTGHIEPGQSSSVSLLSTPELGTSVMSTPLGSAGEEDDEEEGSDVEYVTMSLKPSAIDALANFLEPL